MGRRKDALIKKYGPLTDIEDSTLENGDIAPLFVRLFNILSIVLSISPDVPIPI